MSIHPKGKVGSLDTVHFRIRMTQSMAASSLSLRTGALSNICNKNRMTSPIIKLRKKRRRSLDNLLHHWLISRGCLKHSPRSRNSCKVGIIWRTLLTIWRNETLDSNRFIHFFISRHSSCFIRALYPIPGLTQHRSQFQSMLRILKTYVAHFP